MEEKVADYIRTEMVMMIILLTTQFSQEIHSSWRNLRVPLVDNDFSREINSHPIISAHCKNVCPRGEGVQCSSPNNNVATKRNKRKQEGEGEGETVNKNTRKGRREGKNTDFVAPIPAMGDSKVSAMLMTPNV
jgi:hypothetical protein